MREISNSDTEVRLTNSMLLDTVAARDEVVDDRDGNQDNRPDHAESGQFSDLAVLPELKDGYRNHLSLRARQKNRHRKFFGREQEDKDPTA
jgi:hypothetical protein